MKLSLGYGKRKIAFEYDPNQFEVLGHEGHETPLSDRQIGEKLDNPIGPPIESRIGKGETVLIVVPDATREVGCGQIVNLLVRRLISNGTMPFEINIIFATGIHRPVTDEEKREILTPFIAQRIKTLDHDPRDLMQVLRIGETSSGIPAELNRKLTEYDHTILIGGVNFHYFAGFSGGRKLICPGLASAKTVSETHKLAFDFELKTRRAGVELGKLNGNPVHDAFIEVVEKKPPTFGINTVVNNQGEIVELSCGDWKESHERLCETYSDEKTIKIPHKREFVIVSCGGSPHDLNMIQAHKALDMASRACSDGGTILFLAQCKNGLGRDDFIDWFEATNSKDLAERLCARYQVNGQTAWSLLTKTEKFEIQIVTELSNEETSKMRLRKIDMVPEHIDGKTITKDQGYILPFGAKFKIEMAAK